jgi:hypothetical protein
MNRDSLELVKQDLLEKSKELTEVLEGCFVGRIKFKENCIFNKFTNKPSTDKGHNKNINDLKDSFRTCKNILDITSNDEKWKEQLKTIYKKDYPSDNIYERPISPPISPKKRSPKKPSSRGYKRVIKKKGKGTLTSKRILKKK